MNLIVKEEDNISLRRDVTNREMFGGGDVGREDTLLVKGKLGRDQERVRVGKVDEEDGGG